MTDQPAPPTSALRRSWSVAFLVRAVADALDTRFAAVAVHGELSGCTRAASGHVYFTLKDADGGAATLRCTMFRRAAVLLDFRPADGQRVELRGRVSVYEPRGELQFVVEAMQLAGAGTLYEQYLRLKDRLAALGLFDAARKRPLPPHVERLGIVTSLGAAALHDVCAALARRSPHVHVVIYPSLVQGVEAPAALVEAIALANRRAEVDALLVCRGGGSLEDLWAFNDERVVRAIAGSALPVVCGVGHETDVTLSDFAADLRAATPTAAAELAAPRTADGLQALEALADALQRRLRRRLDALAQRLDALASRAARPSDLVARQQQRLALLQQRGAAAPMQAALRQRAALVQLQARLRRAAAVAALQHRHLLQSLGDRCGAVDPQRVLQRGYAWLADADGHALVSVSQTQPGAAVQATLQDGRLQLRVLRPTPKTRRKRPIATPT